MIQFAILSTEFRKSQRPPVQTVQVTQDLLSRVVPMNIRARPRVQTKLVSRMPGRQPAQINGKKSPILGSSVAGLLSIPLPKSLPEHKKADKDQSEASDRSSTEALNPQTHRENFTTPVSPRPTSLPSPARPEQPQKEAPDELLAQKKQPVDGKDLQDLLTKNPNLPSQSVILGICDDGLPIALDLNDPAPGSLLVMGDDRQDQLKMLHLVVSSVAGRNSARSIQFLVFSHQPDHWRSWIHESGFDRHCLGVIETNENMVSDWILQAADWTEQRRLGQRSGPPVLLVIDSLSFLPGLPYDIRLNFDWMIKEGPPAQVWTLATISTELAASIGSRFLRPFGTRILGRTNSPDVYARLTNLDEQKSFQFTQPGRFLVQAGDQWIQFSLPGS